MDITAAALGVAAVLEAVAEDSEVSAEEAAVAAAPGEDSKKRRKE